MPKDDQDIGNGKDKAKEPAGKGSNDFLPAKPYPWNRFQDYREVYEKQDEFLELYAKTGLIAPSARAVGLSPSTITKWRRIDAIFEERFIFATNVANTIIEDEAFRRAVYGVKKPIYYRSELIGETTEYSDSLLKLLLQSRMPNKYSEGQTAAGGNNTVIILPSNGREFIPENDIKRGEVIKEEIRNVDIPERKEDITDLDSTPCA